MPEPKIYAATGRANDAVPIRPLCGTRKAAQAYADRVTRSGWWAENAPGFHNYEDPPPSRVWVWVSDEDDDGGSMNPDLITVMGDQEMPSIILGTGIVNDHPAIADKWVILHELAHIMVNQVEGEGHHGRQFVMSFIGLVRQFLGQRAALALIQACKDLRIRLDYRLLVS